MGACMGSEASQKIANPNAPSQFTQTGQLPKSSERPYLSSKGQDATQGMQPIRKDNLSTSISQKGSIEADYRKMLTPEIFGYVSDLPNSLFRSGTIASQSAKLMRLTKEVSKFAEFLPCEHTNSIFVRCDEAHLDSMNVLIAGSKGTPYANGLYHFEVICDDSFPSSPPKMQLLTGKMKVRFNPNLYESGYICLSLLGTWAGSGCQTWSPIRSTILQIFVSIQSLIMSNDVIFNEPGHESRKGTSEGQLQNEGYSNVVKLANIQYAMIEIIKKPPKGFERAVRQHFFIKREEILQECEEWLKQQNKPYTNCGQNPRYEALISQKNYGTLLSQQIEELRGLLQSLKPQ